MGKLEKIPIQIYLEPEQDKIIGFLSKESGKSKAAVIRLCISKFLDNLPSEEDPALRNMPESGQDLLGPVTGAGCRKYPDEISGPGF